MSYTFFDFLQLIGSLGVFIFGMKIFSDGLQKIAGGKLRSILKGMTRNRFTGVVTGFGTTAITQSSTTTTVMVVSFVNAGLLTFIESTGVIMGANIGTTITAWMVSVFGFKFQITPIAIATIGIFFPFLFAGNIKLRNIAEAMIGFGILFIGLEFIKDSVPDIDENPEIFAFLRSYTDLGYLSILLFVGVGTILTLLTQSSSAATAITLVMLFQGWIDFPIAAAMILGENIGTTVTANIAALIGNVHAKRAARFHFFFNVIGVLWMLLLIYPFLNLMDYIISSAIPGSPSIMSGAEEARANATLGLSLFHTTFNILNVVLLFGFVPLIIKLVEKIQPMKTEGDDQFQIQYINSGLMSSADLSLNQAQRELEMFGKVVEKMHYSFKALLLKKQSKQRKFIEKIKKREELADNLELQIGEYLTQISENSNPSKSAVRRIRNFHNIINDLERIGDLYYQMAKTVERSIDNDEELEEDVVKDVDVMLEVIHNAMLNMRNNLSRESKDVDVMAALELEKQVNATRDRLRNLHYARLEKNSYSVKEGIIFLDLLNRLEKIGDHIMNVNEACAGKRLKVISMEPEITPVDDK